MFGIKLQKKFFIEIISIAIPLILSNVLQQLYNTADAIIVGKGVGDDALSAVGSSGYIIIILTYIFIGLTVGASINVSQAYGAKDDKHISDLVHTALGVAILSGVILTLIGFFGASWFLKLTGVPEEVYPLALEYLKIYFLGITFSVIYNMGSALLRGVGNTRIAFYCLVVATSVNIVLDFIFVFYFDWGVKSVAIATIISQMFSAAIILYTLINRKDSCKLYLSKIGFREKEVKEILRLGLPSGLQSVVQSFSNLYVQTKIYTFGSVVLAGVTAYTKVEGFFYMAIEGVALSMSIISGQLVGKKETEKIPTYFVYSIIILTMVILPLSILFLVYDKEIISSLIQNENSIREGIKMLKIIVPLYLIYGISQTLSNIIKGIGHTKKSMKIVLIFTCGFRVLWVSLVMILYKDTALLYYVYPVSWILTSSIFYMYYRKMKSKNFIG